MLLLMRKRGNLLRGKNKQLQKQTVPRVGAQQQAGSLWHTE